MTWIGWAGVVIAAGMFVAVMIICLPDKIKWRRREKDEQR